MALSELSAAESLGPLFLFIVSNKGPSRLVPVCTTDNLRGNAMQWEKR